MPSRLITWMFLAALAVGCVLRARDLSLPCYENGHRGATAAFFALMAKNHLRYGLLSTGGVGVLNHVRVDEQHFNYYLHHPPGAILLATVGASLGGTNPMGLRLVFLPLSIGVVLLVYRLARTRGRFAAAAAGSIAALAPIGAYYGAFVNFEIPTLFFTLLTLYLYLRYVRRGRDKDHLRALLAMSAAVLCDWIALGLPLCLLVLAPLRRAAAPTAPGGLFRRPGPVALAAQLLAVGVATVVLVKALYWIQLARYGVDPEGGSGVRYYLQATPLAAGFQWGGYLERMLHFVAGDLRSWLRGEPLLGGDAYAGGLLGLPLLAATLVGTGAVLLRVARRRLDDFVVAVLVLLAIGLANILILANHAMGHDYYLLYLLPSIALAAGAALDLAAGPRPASPRAVAATVVLGVLLVQLATASVAVQDQRRRTQLSTLGELIAQYTDVNDVVLLPDYYTLQVAVTADRFVWHAPHVHGLESAKDWARRCGMAGRPVVYLVTRSRKDTLDADLLATLERDAERAVRGPFQAFELGPLEPVPRVGP